MAAVCEQGFEMIEPGKEMLVVQESKINEQRNLHTQSLQKRLQEWDRVDAPSSVDKYFQSKQKSNNMAQILFNYNVSMKQFVDANAKIQEMVTEVFDQKIGKYIRKDIKVTHLKLQKNQKFNDLNVYQNAKKLSDIHPEWFINSEEISISVHELQEEIKEICIKIQKITQKLKTCESYQSFLKFPFLSFEVYKIEADCMKLLWNQGERPFDFEANSKYILDNYKLLLPFICKTCHKPITRTKEPVFKLGKEINFSDLREFIPNHTHAKPN